MQELSFKSQRVLIENGQPLLPDVQHGPGRPARSLPVLEGNQNLGVLDVNEGAMVSDVRNPALRML
jgi:hypothetical protein